MTLRTHTIEKKKDTHKQIWEWEETPELLAAIGQLHKSSEAVKSIKYQICMLEPTILQNHANLW